MKILVTGAAGFIGSHLAERLSELGHEVLALDCMTDYYAHALKTLNAAALTAKGIPFFALDLAEDGLGEALQGVDFVYHLAAQPGISAATPFETYMRNNITATYRLLEAVKQIPGFQGFINIATSSVYGGDATGNEETPTKPTSYYGVTKLAAEQLALSYQRDQGLPVASLRLFSVYGPRERPEKLFSKLIRCTLEDRAFPLYAGSDAHVRSFTYVGDIVDGFVAVLQNWDKCVGEIFNIGTDTTITTGEGIQFIADIIGKPAQITQMPKRPGDQLKTHANIEKARRLLGYNPTTLPRTGFEKQVAWYMNEIHGKVAF